MSLFGLVVDIFTDGYVIIIKIFQAFNYQRDYFGGYTIDIEDICKADVHCSLHLCHANLGMVSTTLGGVGGENLDMQRRAARPFCY